MKKLKVFMNKIRVNYEKNKEKFFIILATILIGAITITATYFFRNNKAKADVYVNPQLFTPNTNIDVITNNTVKTKHIDPLMGYATMINGQKYTIYYKNYGQYTNWAFQIKEHDTGIFQIVTTGSDDMFRTFTYTKTTGQVDVRLMSTPQGGNLPNGVQLEIFIWQGEVDNENIQNNAYYQIGINRGEQQGYINGYNDGLQANTYNSNTSKGVFENCIWGWGQMRGYLNIGDTPMSNSNPNIYINGYKGGILINNTSTTTGTSQIIDDIYGQLDYQTPLQLVNRYYFPDGGIPTSTLQNIFIARAENYTTVASGFQSAVDLHIYYTSGETEDYEGSRNTETYIIYPKEDRNIYAIDVVYWLTQSTYQNLYQVAIYQTTDYTEAFFAGKQSVQSEIDTQYTEGYTTGRNIGYNDGYNDGVNSAHEYTFTNLLFSAIDAPVSAAMQMFDVEILGFNFRYVIISLFTISIAICIMKFTHGG